VFPVLIITVEDSYSGGNGRVMESLSVQLLVIMAPIQVLAEVIQAPGLTSM